MRIESYFLYQKVKNKEKPLCLFGKRFLFILVLLLSSYLLVFSQGTSGKTERIMEIINSLKQTILSQRAQLQDLNLTLNEKEQQLLNSEKLAEDLKLTISDLEKSIADLNKRINELETNILENERLVKDLETQIENSKILYSNLNRSLQKEKTKNKILGFFTGGVGIATVVFILLWVKELILGGV
jgi:peptidoglycan hydrolase CwlO-like protein